MEIRLVTLADAANTSQTGKLNILGEFDHVYISSMPGKFRHCVAVVRGRIHPSERGQTKKIEMRLIDEDGQTLMYGSVDLEIPADAPPQRTTVNLIVPLPQMRFQRYGRHEICVLVNGEHKESVELNVSPPIMPPPGAPEED